MECELLCSSACSWNIRDDWGHHALRTNTHTQFANSTPGHWDMGVWECHMIFPTILCLKSHNKPPLLNSSAFSSFFLLHICSFPDSKFLLLGAFFTVLPNQLVTEQTYCKYRPPPLLLSCQDDMKASVAAMHTLPAFLTPCNFRASTATKK